jgi:hypothetical protein
LALRYFLTFIKYVFSRNFNPSILHIRSEKTLYHTCVFVLFVFVLCLVYQMLPVFSNVYLYYVKQTLSVKLIFFPFISQSDIVSTNIVTLILESKIGQYDVTLWRLIPIKSMTSVLEVSTM